MTQLVPQVNKKDYVVIQTTREAGGLNKPQLLRVTAVDKLSGDFSGRLEKDPHLQEIELTATVNDLLVNLGRSPKPGKVYGYDLERLYRGSDDDLHFFTQPDPAHLEKFLKGMASGQALLKKKGFGRLIDTVQYVTEVVNKNGKYAGMYKHSRNPDKNPHRVLLTVGEKTIQNASAASYAYVYLHEFAHAVHFQLLNERNHLNAKWINLFVTSIEARSVKPERSAQLLELVRAHEGSVRELLVASDSDTQADIKLVFRWLHETRNLSKEEITILRTSASDRAKATLEEVWPRITVRSKKLKPLVTEYACKNWRELFAESVSLYLLSKELPKQVLVLVEDSLSQANQLAKTAAYQRTAP